MFGWNRIVSQFRSLLAPAPLPAPRRAINRTRDTELASRLEVADRGQTRRKGLLGRHGLAPGQGLWIVPCESVHTFWMQFPIDLVYLDRDSRVRKLRANVPAWRFSMCLSAHSVIELAAGAIAQTQTERGDLIEMCPENTGEAEGTL